MLHLFRSSIKGAKFRIVWYTGMELVWAVNSATGIVRDSAFQCQENSNKSVEFVLLNSFWERISSAVLSNPAALSMDQESAADVQRRLS